MKLTIFIYLLIGLSFISCKKDAPIEVEREFEGILEQTINLGGSLNESIQSIVKTTDGGFICAGYSQSNDAPTLPSTYGENDYLILKYDKSFNLEWSKMYGGSSDDKAFRIIQTSDNGYAVCGTTKSNDFDVSGNQGQKDFWILRLKADGNILWKKTIGFSGDEESFSIIQTKDGGFFTCGYLDVTASGGLGNDNGKKNTKHGIGEVWGIKLDSDGNKIWRRYFGGSNNDRAYDVVETNEGDFILAGSTESDDYDVSNAKGSYDMWILKVSALGDLIWEKSFGGTNIDVCYKINRTDNGYILVGDTRSNDLDITNNNGFSDVWIIKIDYNGNMIWQKNYGGTSFDSAKSVYRTKNNEFIVAGNTRSNDINLNENKGQNDIWVFKINEDGAILWSKSFGGSKIDIANDVIQTDDNKLILVGESTSSDGDILANNGFTDAIIMLLK